jgi:DNA-binding transcriptional ArsR family regulator/rhodanese-related sulfurtransferase
MSMKRIHHELTAKLCQALASPARLHALTLLAQRPWTVGQLAAEQGESIASVSAHLKVLRAAHLIEVERRGREVWCRADSPEIIRLLAAAQRAAEMVLPELREAADRADEDSFLLHNLDFQEIATAATCGKLTLVDLRPNPEFRVGHLPGAISRPFGILAETDLSDLAGKNPVVGYCRGPWCPKARRGVELLNEKGIPTKRLRAGVVEWQAAGFPLEQ